MIFCGVGTNGQVIIMANLVAPYTVGDTLTLTCTRIPPVDTTNSTVTYLWECGGCFADQSTNMTVMRTLTDMDTSMIDCSVMVDNVAFTTNMPFDLQVTQGIFHSDNYKKIIKRGVGIDHCNKSRNLLR